MNTIFMTKFKLGSNVSKDYLFNGSCHAMNVNTELTTEGN